MSKIIIAVTSQPWSEKNGDDSIEIKEPAAFLL